MRLLHLGPESRVSANPGTARKRVSNRHRAAPEILGLDHVYLSVADFARSEVFYDRVMKRLGFKKGTFPIGGEPHCHYFNRNLQISIRPARSADPATTTHRRAASRFSSSELRGGRRRSTTPAVAVASRWKGRVWPEYAPDYYAVFFSDPDGMRFEVMNYRKGRKTVRRVWNELEGFVNPMGRLQRKRAKAREVDAESNPVLPSPVQLREREAWRGACCFFSKRRDTRVRVQESMAGAGKFSWILSGGDKERNPMPSPLPHQRTPDSLRRSQSCKTVRLQPPLP